MKQLTQKLGSGEMLINDVPPPQAGKGLILVKNHYSVISSGTEGTTVTSARKSLLGKARERPQQAKQVIDTVITQGPVQAYRAVKKKLDGLSPLGYSCAGEVIQVGSEVMGFREGDLVACAGIGFASHAEIISVPVNLAVKLSPLANLQHAAYNTIGAIAMQGVRTARLSIGESCVVIGLGLIGQITSLILKASGVQVIGVDTNAKALDFAIENKSIDSGFNTGESNLETKIYALTNGEGADSVIITAGTNSLEPINLAGAVARKKGNVVVVGLVPTGFDRNPYWYEKELELRMACSYGPGRYDTAYEQHGTDYPYAYVRWTQNRNMQAFQRLLEKKAIDLNHLTTHKFAFDDVLEAYDLILKRDQYFAGISLKYDVTRPQNENKIRINAPLPLSSLSVSFIGAGSYAQSHLLPNLPSNKFVSRIGVFSNSGTTSRGVADRFNFNFCTSERSDIYKSKSNVIFIATRHDSHCEYVLESLRSGANVFVEKPLCLNEAELVAIMDAEKSSAGSIMVGFNRRFSPLVNELKSYINTEPVNMIYRINAGHIPKDHWIQDPKVGGGRIVGEACHFIDLLLYLNGSKPVSVSAQAIGSDSSVIENVNISLLFENGSIGTISYVSNGGKSLAKEYLEVHSQSASMVIDDFKKLKVFREKRGKGMSKNIQNKGQREMMNAYFKNLSLGGTNLIPIDDIFAVTRATFLIVESTLDNGRKINIRL